MGAGPWNSGQNRSIFGWARHEQERPEYSTQTLRDSPGLRDNETVPGIHAGERRREAMAYTLEQFCVDCRAIVQGAPRIEAGLPRIADKLAQLLANPSFVAATFNDDLPPGKRVLHHSAETDVYVMAHVQQAGKGGSPHSHGASWAVYGNARGQTDMTEWRRINPDSDDHAVLERADSYSIGPGQSRAYGPGVIHSTAHPATAWVIRVTGTDLDVIPRYRFRPKQDKILEKA